MELGLAPIQSKSTQYKDSTKIKSKYTSRLTSTNIGTLNINGLSKKSKVYNVSKFSVAYNIDFLLLQEMRKNCIDELPLLSHKFVHCSGHPSNGVGIVFNSRKYTIQNTFKSQQLIIVEFRRNSDSHIFTVASAYINPTP